MGNSVENVPHVIDQSIRAGSKAGAEAASNVIGAGTPLPTDHAVMAFQFGFITEFASRLLAGGYMPPAPEMWLGYMMMAVKTAQIAATAYNQSEGDPAKVEEAVRQATEAFQREYGQAKTPRG